MSSARTGRGKARQPLSRERVLAAAVELADAEGIDAVTMRRVGEQLRVEAMSLYNHVTSKDDLLDGMIDVVFSEVDLPDADAGWSDAMARRARSMRAVLLRHRWAVGLMDSRVAPGPANLRHHDAMLGCSRRAGFSVEMAAHAYSLLDSYVYGFVLQEVMLPFDLSVDGSNLEEMVQTILPDISADYPYLAELTVEHVLQVGYNYSDEFDFGLNLLLEAMAARAAPGSVRSTRTR